MKIKINRIDDNELMIHADIVQLTIEEISEGENEYKETIVFEPPIVVEGSLYDGQTNFYTNWDFGMQEVTCLSYGAAYGLGQDADWKDKFINNVKYDLYHAFFHTSIDPNYGVPHYAIFGCLCLKGRAKQVNKDGSLSVIQDIP